MLAVTEEIVRAGGAEFAVFRLADAPSSGRKLLLWGHGWGHAHQALLPLAQALQPVADSLLVDFPGFGVSPPPPAPWGTADYADMIGEWLAGEMPARRIWIGHSFGCRVGLQLAARHPDAVDALVLVAAAGLRPRPKLLTRLRHLPRRLAFRAARAVTPEGPARERLRERYGSSDYRNAGAMRPTFVRVVNEDLSEIARRIRLPVVLIHGDGDSESPPEIAERLHRLIPGARLHLLRGFDHWSILTDGRHQVVNLIADLLEQPA